MIPSVGPGTSEAVAARIPGPGTGVVVARPELFRRLSGPARVAVVSAPAGSGKTVLVRSWIGAAKLADSAGWVAAGPDERDPRQFWLAVVAALRRTVPGSELVQPLTAAPDLDGWAIAERLLADLAPLRDRIWLVVDDVHELSPDALRQLELLVLRAPPVLRFVLASRHDLRLGLHRLRLEGELTEIRAADLRFSVPEAQELLAVAGVQLPQSAVKMLQQRTEGWAAGLRLAALSLAGHGDPARLADRFSGTERTVAEYLLAEVLDRQCGEVRRLLLRTSILDRVNGELADLLTGGHGGERILQDLEEANAFVMSLDGARSWFRYHQLFADLLQLELRRAAPAEVAGLHRAASAWFAGHGYPVEAIRHAQAGGDWDLAARLLAGHWPGLHLDGQSAAIHELLAGFPPGLCATDAGLAAVAATDELAYGSVQAADQYLALAARATGTVPQARRPQALLLGMTRLLLAHQQGNLPALAEEAERLQAIAETPDVTQPMTGTGEVGGEDLRALVLIGLGTTEIWTARLGEAKRHLEAGIALAHRIGRPFLEFTGLAYLAGVEVYRSFAVAAERSLQAVDLAEQHGWAGEPAAGQAYGILGVVLAMQGRLEEAGLWVDRAQRAFRAEAQPGSGLAIYYMSGVLELARGRNAAALAAFQAAERLAGRLAAPHHLLPRAQAMLLVALVRLGEPEQAEQVLAGLSDQRREHGDLRIAEAVLRLAQHDPHAASAAVAPVIDAAPEGAGRAQLAHAFLLEAIARDELGDEEAAGRALERALDLAEPDGALSWFLLHPAPALLERHARRGTGHAALIAEILSLLPGRKPGAPPAGPPPLGEPLSDSELRVLRYLPTNLTAPEIASELSVSRNTVKTHTRNLYAKLGTHRRTEAVARARALGLLAPSGLSAAGR
jgi:LuxR family transcriptional regulator, maltose regulon positive regulatory protein